MTDPRLQAAASQLQDIAGSVAEEAEQLTGHIRAVGEHARDIAGLAAALDHAAGDIEAALRDQLGRLDRAREASAGNEPALSALAESTRAIAEMTAAISDVAGQSRLLALNARIEAARADSGRGFAVVADQMTVLAQQTRRTTDDIASRTTAVRTHVAVARRTIGDGSRLLEHEHGHVSAITGDMIAQRTRVGDIARLTAETVERIDAAADGIGRVSSAASVVRLLARQIGKSAAAAR